MKRILFIIAFSVIALLSARSVNAQYGCAPYGGECPVASHIVVDKTIRDPREKGDVYVDNLLLSDYQFAPGEDVIFKITIKNTGNNAVDNVTLVDTLPVLTDYLLLSGEVRDMRSIEKSFGTLQSGESKYWYLRVRVKGSSVLPAGIVCGDPNAINRVVVHASNMPDTSDTSSFCIEKKVLGVTIQPKAGAELYVLVAAFVALSGVGLFGSKLVKRIG